MPRRISLFKLLLFGYFPSYSLLPMPPDLSSRRLFNGIVMGFLNSLSPLSSASLFHFFEHSVRRTDPFPLFPEFYLVPDLELKKPEADVFPQNPQYASRPERQASPFLTPSPFHLLELPLCSKASDPSAFPLLIFGDPTARLFFPPSFSFSVAE